MEPSRKGYEDIPPEEAAALAALAAEGTGEKWRYVIYLKIYNDICEFQYLITSI